MRLALKILVVLVIGTVLGLAATWLFVIRGAMPGGVSDGPWKTNLLIGNSGGDMMTRAAVAMHGLLALNRSETVYYSTYTDNSGANLDGACTYRLSGRDLPARWWSITVYGADDFLIANPQNRYSISRTSVTRDASGGFVATIAPKASGPNALPTNGETFNLTLRLYNPAAGVVADPAHVALPSIKRVSCP
ncbi:MAG TPA: DUF1214 domain-containing protein [Rhizomicrobium sp.]